MTPPSTLYRYEPITLQTLRNLKNQVVYLGPPRAFNDPYDCAIGAVLGDLSDTELHQFLNGAVVNASSDTLKTMLREGARKAIAEVAEGFLDKRGVACFTERNDNLLMWSHYANGGRGMCLEFSTSEALFEKAGKVVYSDSIPTVPLGPVLVDKQYDLVTGLFRTKSVHWQYESEWRVIHETAHTPYCYKAESLVGLYFGPNTPHDLVEIVCLILRGQNPSVRLYKGQRSETEFKVEFSASEYLSHVEAIRGGLPMDPARSQAWRP